MSSLKPPSPSDLSRRNYQDLLVALRGDRRVVYHALSHYGPVTTRELAQRMGWDILRVRPRVTELCQLGLARLVGSQSARGVHEGVYAAVSIADYLRASTRDPDLQMQMPL